MASTLPLTVVKRRAVKPALPAFAVAAASSRHSTASEVHKLLQVGRVGSQTVVPQPMAVLTPQKPWVKDKADLTVYNAIFNITGGPAPAIILTPSSGDHLGSVGVQVRNTSAGKLFVIEFLGNSQTGNDFEVELGPTLHLAAGDFKLPIVITSSGATAYCRISAKNYGEPRVSMAVRIGSIKVWAVN